MKERINVIEVIRSGVEKIKTDLARPKEKQLTEEEVAKLQNMVLGWGRETQDKK